MSNREIVLVDRIRIRCGGNTFYVDAYVTCKSDKWAGFLLLDGDLCGTYIKSHTRAEAETAAIELMKSFREKLPGGMELVESD